MKKILLALILFASMSYAACEYYDSFYSSFIDKAIYCPVSEDEGVITLTLNGKDYDYYIAFSTWIGFKNASSKGRYFNRYIKR